MKTLRLPAILLVSALLVAGCGTHLENGGAYAPGTSTTSTDASGATVTNFTPSAQADLPFYIVDSSYKLAYDAVDGILKFERDNRAQVATLSPKIKPALDAIRPTVKDIDHRWALARQAYKANPIPANLTTMQSILAEIQRLVPVVQSQLTVPTTPLKPTP